MNKTRLLAALTLLGASSIASLTLAQTLTPAQQARQKQMQAAQAAARARAAAAAGTATTAPTTAATPTPTSPPAPTATATTPPQPTATTTAAPTTTASAAPPKSTASAAASAAPATSGSAAPAAAVHPDTTAIALDIEALRKSRPERRHAEFLDMQSRWGNVLTDPRAADELKLHAQRLAYLQRIRALGEKDPTFTKGVDALITKEETRSSDALNALRSGALPTAAPAAGATK